MRNFWSKFFEVASSDENSVGLITTDESKLDVSNRTISNIQIAKKMVFELVGLTVFQIHWNLRVLRLMWILERGLKTTQMILALLKLQIM